MIKAYPLSRFARTSSDILFNLGLGTGLFNNAKSFRCERGVFYTVPRNSWHSSIRTRPVPQMQRANAKSVALSVTPNSSFAPITPKLLAAHLFPSRRRLRQIRSREITVRGSFREYAHFSASCSGGRLGPRSLDVTGTKLCPNWVRHGRLFSTRRSARNCPQERSRLSPAFRRCW